MNKELIGQILAKIYWCRKLGVPRSKWRKRIVKIMIERNPYFSGSEFCEAWEYIKSEKLI